MAKFEVSFTVRPGHDFDPELMARVLAPYKRETDAVSTQFSVRTVHVFDAITGALEFVNWNVTLEGTHTIALEFARRLRALFPSLHVADPSEDRPADADWYGMYTSAGAERCAELLNRAFERMGMDRDATKLADALKQFAAEREELARTPGFDEAMDTDVRETLWHRLELGARERGFDFMAFERAYEAVTA